MDIKFLIVLFPSEPQVRVNSTDEFVRIPQDNFIAMCHRLSIDCIDLLPTFRAQKNDLKKIFCDHCHLTAEGSSVPATEISRRLCS